MCKSARNIVIQTISEPWLLMNYGSFFQHYALRFFLRNLGYNVVRRPDTTVLKELVRWILPLPYTREYLRYFFNKRQDRPEWPLRGTLRSRFSFLKEYHKLIGPLLEKEPRHDVFAYIAGGDCIWYAIAPYAYFLGKGYNQRARRIAYAASSDWTNVARNEQWVTYIRKAGESFYGVGIRENLGVDICQKLMPRQRVVRVVDPVLLLNRNHYLDIAVKSSVFKKPTLLYYVVNVRSAHLNLSNIESVARELGLSSSVVAIQGSENDVPYDVLIRPSPLEFLACFRDADVVITNSFHGVVFCLIFRKRFVYLSQPSLPGTDVNQRQFELMTRLNITDRSLGANATDEEICKVLNLAIDWENVTIEMEHDITFSQKWLKDQLN